MKVLRRAEVENDGVKLTFYLESGEKLKIGCLFSSYWNAEFFKRDLEKGGAPKTTMEQFEECLNKVREEVAELPDSWTIDGYYIVVPAKKKDVRKATKLVIKQLRKLLKKLSEVSLEENWLKKEMEIEV